MADDALNALTDAAALTAVEAAADPKRAKEEGVGLIFEQILIAFILAFIFRAFVLEAFVIPTGSMATTLLGAHLDFTCPDCGWNFKVNYPTDSGTNAVPSYARVMTQNGVRDRVYNVRCPNCGYRIPRADPNGQGDNDATAPPVSYGDRILVLKHLYLVSDPQRWDVVVFKTPWRAGSNLPEWSTEPYQQNYIKRLVGLPGDTLMLLGGDVYVCRDQKTRAELRPEDFHIARKSDVAQSALWRVVYDDDHRPQGLARAYKNTSDVVALRDPAWAMPWASDAGSWTPHERAGGGGFDFDGRQNGTLRFDPTADPQTFPLTDFLTYDVTFNDQRVSRNETPAEASDTFNRDFGPTYVGPGGIRLNAVSDLKLDLSYQRAAGDGGPLLLRLGKRGDVFEAELTPNHAKLRRTAADGTVTLIGDVATGVDFADAAAIEFSNSDYRVRLKVAGKTVIETTDAQYSPDVAKLLAAELDDEAEPLPTAEIEARGGPCRIRHLSLWRDLYHTARDQNGRLNDYDYRYASPFDFPDHVVRLGEGEYFTLGDNPFLSGDARIWAEGVHLPYEGDLSVEGGRVPERFMLGRAFFVYWPASHRPGGGLPALVPNFGDMRFIR